METEVCPINPINPINHGSDKHMRRYKVKTKEGGGSEFMVQLPVV